MGSFAKTVIFTTANSIQMLAFLFAGWKLWQHKCTQPFLIVIWVLFTMQCVISVLEACKYGAVIYGFDDTRQELIIVSLFNSSLFLYTLGHWIFGFQYFASAKEIHAFLYRQRNSKFRKYKHVLFWCGNIAISISSVICLWVDILRTK